jgi:hypothetical protein
MSCIPIGWNWWHAVSTLSAVVLDQIEDRTNHEMLKSSKDLSSEGQIPSGMVG